MAEFHRLPTRDDRASESWHRLEAVAEARAREAPAAAMPSLDHLRLEDYESVYEPAADTFLLLDALKYEVDRGTFDCMSDPVVALEIGCGSGVPSVFFRQAWLTRRHVRNASESPLPLISLVTDINPKALSVTLRTAKANGISTASDCFEAIQCDLAGPLLRRLQGQVDVLIFNPPYVPTPEEEVGSTGIEAAWAGGAHGRQVIDRALPQIAELLRPVTGIAYVITVDDNLPEELEKVLNIRYKLECIPLFRRRTRNERLSVQKISWKPLRS